MRNFDFIKVRLVRDEDPFPYRVHTRVQGDLYRAVCVNSYGEMPNTPEHADMGIDYHDADEVSVNFIYENSITRMGWRSEADLPAGEKLAEKRCMLF